MRSSIGNLSPELAEKCEALAGKAPPARAWPSEKAFQADVVKEAKRTGWRFYHVRFSYQSRIGYPDLTLWRERIIWIELKAEDGVVSPEQAEIHEELRAAGGEVYVFKPSQWLSILDALE